MDHCMKYILLFAILNLALCNQLLSQDAKEGFFLTISGGYSYTGKDLISFNLTQITSADLIPSYKNLYNPSYEPIDPWDTLPLDPPNIYTSYSSTKEKLNLVESTITPEISWGYEWEESGISIDLSNEIYTYELNDVFLMNNTFNLNDKLNSSKLNFNYFYKFNYDLPITTYLGGGIGLNFLIGHFTANNLTRNEISANDLVRKLKITANAFAGLGWAITYNVELFVNYKVSDLAIRTYSNESNGSLGTQGIKKDSFLTQKIAVGIKYYFG